MPDEKPPSHGPAAGSQNPAAAEQPTAKGGKPKASKADKLKFAALIGVLLVLLGVGIACIPYFSGLANGDTRAQTVEQIRSKGPWGVLIIIGLEVVQVVVAFIPGEVVQTIAGILYGTFGGWLICIAGIAISSIIIYKLVEKLGMPFVRDMVPEKQIERLDFLKGNKKGDFIVFLLFFIPGLPKDVFTYLVPLIDMPLKRYLPLQLIARTPALLASTYAGAKFTSGEYGKMIAVFVICGALGILGIVFYDRIMAFFGGKKEEAKEKLLEAHEEHQVHREERHDARSVKRKSLSRPALPGGAIKLHAPGESWEHVKARNAASDAAAQAASATAAARTASTLDAAAQAGGASEAAAQAGGASEAAAPAGGTSGAAASTDAAATDSRG